MTRSGNTYYYMADGLGSIRNVVESDEDVANTYDYYAFGNTLGTPTVGVTNPFEYTPREFEDGSVNTTFYYRNRYYMSGLGIFTSRDAMWADIRRGYEYARNQPSSTIDPYGLYGPEVHDDITFFMGLHVGLSYDEADRIAKADQAFDTNFGTSPWNPLTGWRHSRPLDDILNDLCAGARGTGLTPEELGALLHQVQDHYSHYAHGYRWPPFGFGHVFESLAYDPKYNPSPFPVSPAEIPDDFDPAVDQLDKDMLNMTRDLLRAAAENRLRCWCDEHGY